MSQTRAEYAQVLFTNLLRFIDQKLVGKEELLRQTPLAGYLDQMRTMNLAMCAALAQTGFLSWAVIEPRVVDPMRKLGVTLDENEVAFVRESLEGLTLLFSA